MDQPQAILDPLDVPEIGPPQDQADASSGSVLDRLRARRRALVADRRLDLAVPGIYDQPDEPTVVLRYAPLSADAYTRLATHVTPGAPPVGSDADYIAAIIDACRDVLVGEAPGAPLAPIDDRPCRIGARLADLLGLEVEDARAGRPRAPQSDAEVVLSLFQGEGGWIANHAVAVMGFSAAASSEIDRDVRGESNGRPN